MKRIRAAGSWNSCRSLGGRQVGQSASTLYARLSAKVAASRLLIPPIQTNFEACKISSGETNGVRCLTIPVKRKGDADTLA